MSYIQVILPLKLDWVPFYRVPEGDVNIGDKVKVAFAGKEYTGVTMAVASGLPAGLDAAKVKDILSIESQLAPITPEEIRFWDMVGGYYMCSVGEVYKTACPAVKISQEEVKARSRERLKIRIARTEELLAKARKDSTRQKYSELLDALRSELGVSPARAATAIELTEEQERAAGMARKAFLAGKAALLHGVTGSGKTEIYCKLALETMEKGRNVLFLVPEIAMSRQLETRLEGYFGDSLMVFHSHETAARRGAVADRLASSDGKGQIILGTRSALFLPHRNLGLVIVDEEHDGSYKQDSPAPRYNGRDTAMMLASVHAGCHCILGSATPSLESLYNCSTGKYEYIRLDRKYHGAQEAPLEIIDTIAERKKNGMVGSYSRKLIGKMEKALAEGGQVLILRSRRSYSPVVQCRECGDIPKCPRCNVSLSLHRTAGAQPAEDAPAGAGRLVCHHCGYSIKSNGYCRSCGGALTGLGAGTQKLEEEAKALFPGARIARLDSDTARDARFEEDTIRKFDSGEIDILIGTQIVAKGFDFGGLSLVAVMAADSLLAVEDFRADEKALQLLEQVRGRCGRRDAKGLFVVQTARPGHPVFSGIGRPDNALALMQERAAFGYPPYMRIVTLSINDRFDDRCQRDADSLASSVRTSLGDVMAGNGMTVVGPYAPGQGREGGVAFREIRIALRRDRKLKATKERILAAVREWEKTQKGRVKVAIDVDPF